MKKCVALALVLLSLVSLAGCGTEPPSKPDYSAYAGIVADPKGWYDELMAMPIANENMTEDELRQLCVDAMRANLTFRWTPTMDINYTYTLVGRISQVSLPAGIAYSGLCYCNDNARGNVWKALDYYDVETGALDIAAMNGSVLSVLSSGCARACQWGWDRVSNSHNLDTMDSFNQYYSNIVPVGPYTYQLGKYSFNVGNGTKDIIRDNGEDVILDSYAVMKKADGVYSSSSYHVMMVAEDPVIVRDSDGNIDPKESYVLVLEQVTTGQNTIQENGVTLRGLGGVDNKYTFRQLLDWGYVPFTVKELIGQDPVEAGDAWVGGLNERLENGADITYDTLMGKMLFANYAICTMEMQIKNPDGEVLATHKYGLLSKPNTTKATVNALSFDETAIAYANGKNTVHVYVRLSTGELKEAFRTVLKFQ